MDIEMANAKCKSGLSHSLAVSLFINSLIQNRMHILSYAAWNI